MKHSQIAHMVVAIFFLTFFFAYDDKSSAFILSNWLSNFFKVFLMSFVVVLIHDLSHKYLAYFYGGIASFRIWGVSRFGFATKAKFPITYSGVLLRRFTIKIFSIPLGIILGVLVTLFSSGSFYFFLLESFDLENLKQRRVGRQWVRITEFESALISFAGPFSNILLAFVLVLFNESGALNTFILINCLYAVFHMIPLPKLDGGVIFFSSPIFYLFSFIFISLSVLFLLFNVAIGVFSALILAFLFVVVVMVVKYRRS